MELVLPPTTAVMMTMLECSVQVKASVRSSGYNYCLTINDISLKLYQPQPPPLSAAMMVIFVWWVGPCQGRGEWRYATATSGGQSVTILLDPLKLQLFAGSLDTPLLVSTVYMYIPYMNCLVLH